MIKILTLTLICVTLVFQLAFADQVRARDALVTQLDNEFKSAVNALEDTYRSIKADIMGEASDLNIMKTGMAADAQPSLRVAWFALLRLGVSLFGALIDAIKPKKS